MGRASNLAVAGLADLPGPKAGTVAGRCRLGGALRLRSSRLRCLPKAIKVETFVTSTSQILFQPIEIGAMSVRNRIAMAPMTREFAQDGVPGADVVDYYRRRAEGGTGLIITEGMAVNAAGAHDAPIPLFYQPETIDAARAITDAVHAAGAKIAVQLWHVGIQDSLTQLNPDAVRTRPSRVGPSGIAANGGAGGSALDEQGIANTIADYAKAATAAKQAGFDAIEIHGAHGYLPDQFLWARTNKRSDHYGFAQRTRFGCELVRACRAAVGADLPIIWRFSQWKTGDYDARIADTPDELASILRPLAEAGVDAFHCSTRRFWDPAFGGEATTLAGWARKLTGKPVIAVGSVTLEQDFKEGLSEGVGGISESAPRSKDVDDVARLIEAREFDMIAVGRAMIANPDWANLVRDNRVEALRPFTRDMLARLA
ncbi:MAG: 12-oxophytodienoate reductase [Acidobacteria bacterium]|mgnify:CR=1 FL=1|nr:12-oxophytodienoate reductase [Acidobacteriota bacterium]|tara:strand:+ start:3873 stop:5156 length:1284 start_codon:yes stop_codon:yes gene_type:complete